ncbi:hypothetical protein Psed_5802 [Pseudonocardia dioxanivorans CB1190]|uniref:Uncharacterized protein n=1 Tax=Pseudonocardia dioxanivorans (strain ATCC 55486 / DSM 44775 / JCM 13855 / CB1190) TaxID=675635 RepID=F4D1E1_PSEUX|nr:hypothetical protein [Pseudonocardia dioxanivorans]AEA27929.1 hypothetical protein Psed_5802 [Pseudonocardia dioxanivorans CB1190]
MPDVRQRAGNAVATGQSGTVKVVLDAPTQPGNTVVVIAAGTRDGWLPWPMVLNASGFSSAVDRVEDELAVVVWYQANAPAMSQVSVSTLTGRAFQVQVLELTGLAQSAVLDKVAVGGDNDDYKAGSSTPRSGSTGNTSQADEFVLGIVANRYSSGQSGFTGGLVRLSDTVTPDRSSEDDYKRCRLTVHAQVTNQVGSWSIGAQLPTKRDWIAAVLTFKGGTIGPARMTSVDQAPVLTTSGGSGDLTVFGPLVSTGQPDVFAATGGTGRMGPFELQLRLGGWDGFTIGEGADVRVNRVEGLSGWEMRVSDGDLSRGDGSSRGIDLQSPRQVVIEMNFDDVDHAALEDVTQQLLRALRPQKTEDWDLLFRLPGMPLRILRCRPIKVGNDITAEQLLRRDLTAALRAADPRIYSARERSIPVPVTPAGQTVVDVASVPNIGNAPAWPLIRITNNDVVPVTRVQVVNPSSGSAFEVATVIPPGSQLTGDMLAYVTQSSGNVVSLDEQPKYGAWVPPREPLSIAPDPYAPNGVNAVWCRTTPEGADVLVALEYRDTWSG